MRYSDHKRFVVVLLLMVVLNAVIVPSSADCIEKTYLIGVNALRGKEIAMKSWPPTAEYLTSKTGRPFMIVPISLEDISGVVQREEVDFVLTNPENYAELEAMYGVTRIATMKIRENGNVLKTFGAVIFCRADRNDIREIHDLNGKSFAAVQEVAFGGWQMAWREFKSHGIDPYGDFSRIDFTGFPQDQVVQAVLSGKCDAGTVRTGILESMVREGKINIKDFKILNRQKHDDFPLPHSTSLYPEWAFAKLRNTPDEIAEKVVIALLAMPQDGPTARAAKIAGWTIPQNYEPVHDLMRELHVGLYKNYGKLTLEMVLRRYWFIFVAAAAMVLLSIFIAAHIQTINRKLQKTSSDLKRMRDGLEIQVKERTAEILDSNKALVREVTERKQAQEERENLIAQLQDALAKIKTLRGMIPICSSCKKIRNDSGFWEQIDAYVSAHTEAEFSHGICPECAKKLYPKHFMNTLKETDEPGQ
jgi:two-component system sensor histidine kinase TtrS